MTFKTNLHFHTNKDEKIPRYDIYKYIDYAKEQGFNVLAYTPHKKFLCDNEYVRYAESKEILLVPGTEMEIDKRHIVVLNCDKEIEKVKNFQEFSDYKNKNPQILIIAPHPFVFSRKSLKSNLIKNIGLFDAIEMSVFSNKLFNFNKKAGKAALKYAKPLIATSDTHFLEDLNKGYALIDAGEKTIEDVFAAIKNGNFQNKINPIGPFAMLKHKIKAGLRVFFHYISSQYKILKSGSMKGVNVGGL